LVAVRDGFIAMMPLVIAGSLAVLLNAVIFRDMNGGGLLATWLKIDAGTNGLWAFFGEYLIPIMGNIWWGTFAMLALVLVFTIGYSLGKAYDVSPLSTAVVSIAGYIAIMPQGAPETWGNIWWAYTNFGALLAAVILSLIISQIFVTLMKKNITIKLPENVPPAVGKAFAAIIPGLVAITIAAAVPVLLGGFGVEKNVFEIIALVTEPLKLLGQNVFAAMIYVFFISLFWFFGLHGGNMMGAVTNALYLDPLGANQLAAEAGEALPNIFTTTFFDSYVHLGGAGASLALLIVIFLVSKRADYKAVSKIALSGSIFQINEPVMYGLPVVLNPILLIPFMIIPMVLTFSAWFFTVIGIAGRTYVAIPWVTPPVLGAFLSTGGHFGSALVALVNLLIACVLYYPFVLLSNKETEEK
jgi:PTS system cellobiose-specific IIC component